MTETARIYGGSLYDLAAEENLTGEILGQMEQIVFHLGSLLTTAGCLFQIRHFQYVIFHFIISEAIL